MTDELKHECGVALLRLRQTPGYYARKYGTKHHGFRKMTLLLEKQYNRGQDGAGLAAVALAPKPGVPCFTLRRSAADTPLADLLKTVSGEINSGRDGWSENLLLGHLRYATHGRRELAFCHPFVRDSSFLDRLVLLAGNFNLTDTAGIFDFLVKAGHHPDNTSDGALVLQLLCHALDEEGRSPTARNRLADAVRRTMGVLDGAFAFCGALGNGEAFAIRDANGIRPAYYYLDDEVFAVASERPAIQAAFDCTTDAVRELPPGRLALAHRSGEVEFVDCLAERPKRSCVFERIYFSRANDAHIHQERKRLGAALVPRILEACGDDLANTFFSYIPNSAQVAFHGMLERLVSIAATRGVRLRFGQVAVKDAKFRTFISDAEVRRDFYKHVYDVTYGLVRPVDDTLVVLDDSVVRGNTMRSAILPMLDRLKPRRIVVASSAPPIRYPDCYGIDMATLHELVAFEAAIDVLRRKGRMSVLADAVARARRELREGGPQSNNLDAIYGAMDEAELTDAIAARLRPEVLNAELKVVFQSCADLRACCPCHTGDWYFTGDYPTSGGLRVVNRALVNYDECKNERAY